MFIARQPIFSKTMDVFGYELLFRSGSESIGFDGISSTHATASVIGGLFESGIDEIVDDKRAFINFDAGFIMTDLPELIESHRLIIEVLEDVVADQPLIDRVIELKKKGYKIALDDFIESYDDYPLVRYADIIKFDLMETPLETIGTPVYKALSQGKVLLAEKVEDVGVFELAKMMGFSLFQGYFFSKPKIMGRSNHKSSTKAQYARLISELKKEEPSYQVLAEIIEKDVNLAYRLMRIISARAGDDLVYSIKRALTYMGLKEIERWINILMIQDLGENKPKELMTLSLVRTKFAEMIALHCKLKKIKHEASMMGLFSTLDAILDQNMEEALSDISLPQSIKDTLIKNEGELMPIFRLVKAYEQGDWDLTSSLSDSVKIDEDTLFDAYMTSVKWARDTIRVMYMKQ
ncbi:MAG TPA: diguanylate phosphodiesterase [Clostridiales bacterium UBA8960]|jgi:EAL and modified HD-GYP domain-containing signal transduction protein|nr:diguanylate phosphodiesterase [Clostridiales bacterium UBA8960]